MIKNNTKALEWLNSIIILVIIAIVWSFVALAVVFGVLFVIFSVIEFPPMVFPYAILGIVMLMIKSI